MTNKMINDVPRDLLDLVLTYGCTTDESSEAWDQLRALLAAPTNELREHCKKCAEEVSTWPDWKRNCLGAAPDPIAEADGIGEPVASAFTMPSNENSYGFGYVDGTCIQSLRGYRDHLEGIVDSIPEGPLYSADQLAALQSTIAQLQARAAALNGERG